MSEDADLREELKEGQYFYAELPGDEIGSRVRLVHRVAEVRPRFRFGFGFWTMFYLLLKAKEKRREGNILPEGLISLLFCFCFATNTVYF